MKLCKSIFRIHLIFSLNKILILKFLGLIDFLGAPGGGVEAKVPHEPGGQGPQTKKHKKMLNFFSQNVFLKIFFFNKKNFCWNVCNFFFVPILMNIFLPTFQMIQCKKVLKKICRKKIQRIFFGESSEAQYVSNPSLNEIGVELNFTSTFFGEKSLKSQKLKMNIF